MNVTVRTIWGNVKHDNVRYFNLNDHALEIYGLKTTELDEGQKPYARLIAAYDAGRWESISTTDAETE